MKIVRQWMTQMDIETFQKELTALGGLNLRGEPNLRVVRGDQETKFACGRIIPKYFIPGGAVRTEEKKFRLRNMFTNQLTECTFDEAREVYERSRKLDITNYQIAETCRIVSITVTAKQGYFIEQYYPPDKIKDTPEQWEKNRYQMWFDEEKGKEVMTDMIGPFPFQGVYENFMEGEHLNETLLRAVRRAWQRRNEWHQVKSDDLMVKDVFDAAQKRDDEHEALVDEMLQDAIVPHAFQGVYLNDPSKFIHKGEKDFHV